MISFLDGFYLFSNKVDHEISMQITDFWVSASADTFYDVSGTKENSWFSRDVTSKIQNQEAYNSFTSI